MQQPPFQVVDYPLTETATLSWQPLHTHDLEFAVQRTHRTMTASLRNCKMPARVQEALWHVVRLTVDGRRGWRPARGWWKLLPPTESVTNPDDFPTDPLGVCAWAWREQAWLEQWEIYAAIAEGDLGRMLMITALPLD